MSIQTSWCCYCGEIHKEINDTSIISSYSKWQEEHEKTCAWKTQANEFFNTLTSEENIVIKDLLAYFNSFKNLKEYLENDKDINQIDQTGFYYGGSLSDQAKKIFEQLKSKYKSNNDNSQREREREREQNSPKCAKCSKGKPSNQPGIEGWNFCANCLREQVSSKAWCSWEGCKKVVEWGDWKDEEWEKRQQNIQHLASCQPNCQINHAGLCGDNCDIKWCQKYGNSDGPSRTPPKKDNHNDRPSENQNAKKWGSDFGQLIPVQREGRIKISNNWDDKRAKGYGRQKTCRYCPQTFDYDKSLDFLPAKSKVEKELNNHEANCPKKNNQTEQLKLKQTKWEKDRKKKGSPFYTCSKCWGKVCLDKNIANWIQAKKQGLADLAYHEKKECGKNLDKPKITVCFSPGKGGNEHAPLSYANDINENDLTMEQDNETEVIYREKGNQNTNEKPNRISWTPWLIGGGIVIAAFAFYLLVKRFKK